jgi:hypothetical protein
MNACDGICCPWGHLSGIYCHSVERASDDDKSQNGAIPVIFSPPIFIKMAH